MKFDLLTLFFVFAGLFVLSVAFNAVPSSVINHSYFSSDGLTGNAINNVELSSSLYSSTDFSTLKTSNCVEGASCTSNSDCQQVSNSSPSFTGICDPENKVCDCNPLFLCGSLASENEFKKQNFKSVVGLSTEISTYLFSDMGITLPTKRIFEYPSTNFKETFADYLSETDQPTVLFYDHSVNEKDLTNVVNEAKTLASSSLDKKIDQAKISGNTELQQTYENRKKDLDVKFYSNPKQFTEDNLNKCCKYMNYDQTSVDSFVKNNGIKVIVFVGEFLNKDIFVKKNFERTENVIFLNYESVKEFQKAYTTNVDFSKNNAPAMVVPSGEISTSDVKDTITNIKEYVKKNTKEGSIVDLYQKFEQYFKGCFDEQKDNLAPVIISEKNIVYKQFVQGEKFSPFNMNIFDDQSSFEANIEMVYEGDKLVESSLFKLVDKGNSDYSLSLSKEGSLSTNVLYKIIVSAIDSSDNKATKTFFTYIFPKSAEQITSGVKGWPFLNQDQQNSNLAEIKISNPVDLKVVKTLDFSDAVTKGSQSNPVLPLSIPEKNLRPLSLKTSGGLINAKNTLSSMVGDDDKVVLNLFNKLKLIDLTNGNVLWTLDGSSEGLNYDQPIIFNNKLYVLQYKESDSTVRKGSSTSVDSLKLLSLDLNTGTLLKTIELPKEKPLSSTLTVLNTNSLVFVTENSNMITINMLKNTYSTDSTKLYNYLAMASDNSRMLLDIDELFSRTKNFDSITLESNTLPVSLASDFLVSKLVDGTVVFMNSDGNLCIFNYADMASITCSKKVAMEKGSKLFKAVSMPFSYKNNYIYAGDSTFYSFDKQTNLLVSKNIGSTMSSQPIKNDNFIIVVGSIKSNSTNETNSINNTSSKNQSLKSLSSDDLVLSTSRVVISKNQELMLFDSNFEKKSSLTLDKITSSNLNLISVGDYLVVYDFDNNIMNIIKEVKQEVSLGGGSSKLKKLYLSLHKQDSCNVFSKTGFDVSDANGDPVKGARIVLDGESNEVETTNSLGYARARLESGRYNLEIHKRGFTNKKTTFSISPCREVIEREDNTTGNNTNNSVSSTGTGVVEEQSEEDFSREAVSAGGEDSDTEGSREGSSSVSGNIGTTGTSAGTNNLAGGNVADRTTEVLNTDKEKTNSLRLKSVSSRFSWFIILIFALVALAIYSEEKHRHQVVSSRNNLLRVSARSVSVKNNVSPSNLKKGNASVTSRSAGTKNLASKKRTKNKLSKSVSLKKKSSKSSAMKNKSSKTKSINNKSKKGKTMSSSSRKNVKKSKK